MEHKNNMLVYNGKNLCTLTLTILHSLFNYLTRRMDVLRKKPRGKQSPTFRALRHQLDVTREIIKIGKQKFTEQRMKRIVTLTVVGNNFQHIPYDDQEFSDHL